MVIKRIAAVVIALMLVLGLFAGCSNDSETNTPTATPTETAPGNAEQTPSEEPDVTPELDGPTDVVLPLVSEPVSFEIWCGYAPSAGQQVLDVAETLAYKVAEERTNVHIDFVNPSSADINEQFNLSIVSGDYPDSYQTISSLWASGFDYYIENEIIIDIGDYMEYLPNYDYVRRMDEPTYLSTITDSGSIPGIFMLAKTMQWAVLGPMVRGDFLEKWGLENPETYDELHDVLTVFKDNGVQAPLLAQTTGFDDWLMVGFDTMYSSGHGGVQFLVNDSGEVSFSVLNDGMLEYVTLMNQWYNEGLIEQDFYAKDTAITYAQGRIQNNEAGVTKTLYSAHDLFKPGAIDPDFQLIGLNIPTKNAGDQINISFGAAPITLNKDTLSTITVDCENVELLLRWHDYFWTEEGSLLGNYGVEGVSFEYDENGEPAFLESIYASPDGVSFLAKMFDNAFQPYQGYWYDWERELAPNTSAETMGTKDAWSRNVTPLYNLPAVTLTAEESTEASGILGDCYTYIDEMVLKFISGMVPLTDWDEFESTLESLNVDRAIEIYQAAYDRYLTRG